MNGQFPHELIFCGKSPVIYVVNRDSMGGFNSTSDNVIQELADVVGERLPTETPARHASPPIVLGRQCVLRCQWRRIEAIQSEHEYG